MRYSHKNDPVAYRAKRKGSANTPKVVLSTSRNQSTSFQLRDSTSLHHDKGRFGTFLQAPEGRTTVSRSWYHSYAQCSGTKFTVHFGLASSHLTFRVLHVQQPNRERGGRRAVVDLSVEPPLGWELKVDFSSRSCLGAIAGRLFWACRDVWLHLLCICGIAIGLGR